ncbi:hypothetical protein PITCH_A750001 [uncultured Desulfobacterium sp.]|uniref:Uncharacterized protein n=1 Tax=uncultured Desulfobacterium sp. TaxID=201089 RepID=A0A445N244_9BACT|nr:hypothetical protein PITCH_A750001 [uncultured Desulfobacterium sp.]
MNKHVYFQPIKCGFLWSGILFVFLVVSPCLAVCEPTFEENLEWCKALSTEASYKAMEAQVTCDYGTANLAFNLAEEAEYLAQKMSTLAQESSDPKMAWAAYNLCSQVDTAVTAVIKAANHIVEHSVKKDEIRAAKFLLEDCETTKMKNGKAIETVLAPFRENNRRAEAYPGK